MKLAVFYDEKNEKNRFSSICSSRQMMLSNILRDCNCNTKALHTERIKRLEFGLLRQKVLDELLRLRKISS